MRTKNRQVEQRSGERSAWVFLQFPVTEEERRSFRHRALDQGVSLGTLMRQSLGLPASVLDAPAAHSAQGTRRTRPKEATV